MLPKLTISIDASLAQELKATLRAVGWTISDFRDAYMPDRALVTVRSVLAGHAHREDAVYAVEWAAQALLRDLAEGTVRGSKGLVYLRLESCTAILDGPTLTVQLYQSTSDMLAQDMRRIADYLNFTPDAYPPRK